MKKNIFLGFLLVVIGILLIFLSANYFVFRYFEHILLGSYHIDFSWYCLNFKK